MAQKSSWDSSITSETTLRAERVLFTTGAGIFFRHRVKTDSGAHPTSYLFPRGWSGQSVELTTHLHLRQRLRLHGALLSLPRTSSCRGA